MFQSAGANKLFGSNLPDSYQLPETPKIDRRSERPKYSVFNTHYLVAYPRESVDKTNNCSIFKKINNKH